MPSDIARAVTARASNLQVITDTGMREKVLFTACAVLRKYHYDSNQEEWKMALEPEKKDLSYQYGRLLAVFEKIERDTYDNKEHQKTKDAVQSMHPERRVDIENRHRVREGEPRQHDAQEKEE